MSEKDGGGGMAGDPFFGWRLVQKWVGGYFSVFWGPHNQTTTTNPVVWLGVFVGREEVFVFERGLGGDGGGASDLSKPSIPERTRGGSKEGKSGQVDPAPTTRHNNDEKNRQGARTSKPGCPFIQKKARVKEGEEKSNTP